MKSKVTFAAIALCFALSSQSFGVDLLDRMLGGSGCGCDTSCCATPEPSCGCDGIGMLRGRFFNRGCCDNACDNGCAAKPACDSCGNGCGNACGNGCGCRPKLLSFNVKCLSIPVIVPKICLPKIQLPRPCLRSCCDSGCGNGCAASGNGCCAKAEPACGADNACKPACKPACNPCCRVGLLDRIKARMAAMRCCKKSCCDSGCDSGCKKAATCGCEPACGSDYSAPANKKEAPKPEASNDTATALPPAPVVDPAAFGGVKAQRISDIN